MPAKLFTLITGASEGLGRSFAIECAQRNMNLVLVALSGSGLDQLADFIYRNLGVEVLIFEKDLTLDNSCQQLFADLAVRKVQLNMLINNAGMGNTHLFAEGSASFYEKQIRLNVLATTLITHLFLANYRKNTPSYILNVSSIASFFYLPQKQVYGATKSFIYSFSKSLCKEVKKDDIHVSVLCPGGMNTNLAIILTNRTVNWISRMSIMNPEDVAFIAINALLKSKEVIIPGKMNRFFILLSKILPKVLKNLIINHTVKTIQPDNKWIRYFKGPQTVFNSSVNS